MDSLSFAKGKISFIRNAMSNTGVRIVIMIFFFLFIYQIIYAIGVFFAINTMVLSMWLCWLAMFVLFVAFLPVRNGMFYVKTPLQAALAPAGTALVPSGTVLAPAALAPAALAPEERAAAILARGVNPL